MEREEKQEGAGGKWMGMVRRAITQLRNPLQSVEESIDGRTHPLILTAWAIGPYPVRQLAAAANPRTPSWVIGRLIERASWSHTGVTVLNADGKIRLVDAQGIPSDSGVPLLHGMMVGDSFCGNLWEALSQNPSLRTPQVDRLLAKVHQAFKLDGEWHRKVIENIARHPHLVSWRRTTFAEGRGERAAFSGLHPKVREDQSPQRLQFVSDLQEVEDILLSAQNPSGTTRDLAAMTRRWVAVHQRHAEGVDADVDVDASGVERSFGEGRQIARLFGMSAAFCVTHPASTEETRHTLLSELQVRGTDRAWEEALRTLTLDIRRGETEASEAEVFVRRTDAIKARASVQRDRGASTATGSTGVMHPPVRGEMLPWARLLRAMQQRDARATDARVVASAIERSQETASLVASLPSVRERIEWTAELVRYCLLSAVKEIRLLGVGGAGHLSQSQSQSEGSARKSSLNQTGEEGDRKEISPIGEPCVAETNALQGESIQTLSPQSGPSLGVQSSRGGTSERGEHGSQPDPLRSSATHGSGIQRSSP